MRTEHNILNKIYSLIPKTAFKKISNSIGLEISLKRKSPLFSLLGLRNAPIKTVIDIGANRGQFAKYISHIFPSAKIFCFEPLPGPYAELGKWAKNQKGRVSTINAALGQKNGEIKMILHEDHSPSSSILQTTELSEILFPQTKNQREIQVQQRRLDDIFLENELERDVLIKMDVQGYEDRVIIGGNSVFSLGYACITEISLDMLYQGQATFFNLCNQLFDLGYIYRGNIEQGYGSDGHCISLDALFVKQARR